MPKSIFRIHDRCWRQKDGEVWIPLKPEKFGRLVRLLTASVRTDDSGAARLAGAIPALAATGAILRTRLAARRAEGNRYVRLAVTVACADVRALLRATPRPIVEDRVIVVIEAGGDVVGRAGIAAQ